jgi:hypothetical protein
MELHTPLNGHLSGHRPFTVYEYLLAHLLAWPGELACLPCILHTRNAPSKSYSNPTASGQDGLTIVAQRVLGALPCHWLETSADIRPAS